MLLEFSELFSIPFPSAPLKRMRGRCSREIQQHQHYAVVAVHSEFPEICRHLFKS